MPCQCPTAHAPARHVGGFRFLALVVGLAGFVVGCQGGTPKAAMTTVTTPTVVGDSVGCPTCQISFDTLVNITGSEQAPFFTSTRLALIGEDGFAAAPLMDQGVIALYDRSGVFQRRLLRDGDGPGEMRRIRFLVDRPDGSLLAVGTDGRARLVNVQTGVVVDLKMPENIFPSEVVAGPERSIIASAITPRMPNVAVLSESLAVLTTFGDSLVSADQQVQINPMELESRLGASRAGMIAQVRRKFAPLLTVWSPSGEQTARIERRAMWFPPYTAAEFEESASLLPSQVRIKPEIVAVWPDTGTLVWMVARVPDADWHQVDSLPHPGAEVPISAAGIPTLPDHDWSEFIDTVIEVIDWRRGVVVARRVTDTYAYRMVAAGYLEIPGVGPNGEERRSVVRVRLRP